MVIRMVGLLRGINVGGNRRVPMDDLRRIAHEVGLSDVTTYIQSGNLVFESPESAEQVSELLENGIEAHFGFKVDVIVRTALQWKKLVAKCPFPDAAEVRPNLLHLGLSKKKPSADAAKVLLPKCGPGEMVQLVDDALWIDYASGVARSKLSPAVLDRAAGSCVTARNWKTVLQLASMLKNDAASQ